MTTVTFTFFGDHILKVRASGHSGFAEEGSDIVCAAISALVQAAELGLEKAARLNVKSNTRDGFKEFSVSEHNERSDAILETLRISLKEIEKQYPRHLKTEDRKNV